ncbi:MAG TPA: hypothetical protein VNM92_18275 [Thermoanaerobaculia bacterium]|nr:hypothetical protein [Thermoanaerobaculia bacterium]
MKKASRNLMAAFCVLGFLSISSLSAGVEPMTLQAGVLEVEFSGLISHLLDNSGRDRVIVLKADHHYPVLRIPRNYVSDSDAEVLTCKAAECEIELKRFKISVDLGQVTSGKPFVRDSFKTFVPQLEKITGKKGKKAHLDEKDPPADIVAAYMDLSGGRLSAEAYPSPATFRPDHEKRGLRDFARSTTWTIASPSKIKLQLLPLGTGKTVEMWLTSGSGIRLRISNELSETDDNLGHGHFNHHYKILDGTLPSGPELVESPPARAASARSSKASSPRMTAMQAEAVRATTGPRCSNTTFP